jgi:hypothetical protein
MATLSDCIRMIPVGYEIYEIVFILQPSAQLYYMEFKNSNIYMQVFEDGSIT